MTPEEQVIFTRVYDAEQMLEKTLALLLNAMKEENTVARSGPKVRSARALAEKALKAVKGPNR